MSRRASQIVSVRWLYRFQRLSNRPRPMFLRQYTRHSQLHWYWLSHCSSFSTSRQTLSHTFLDFDKITMDNFGETVMQISWASPNTSWFYFLKCLYISKTEGSMPKVCNIVDFAFFNWGKLMFFTSEIGWSFPQWGLILKRIPNITNWVYSLWLPLRDNLHDTCVVSWP